MKRIFFSLLMGGLLSLPAWAIDYTYDTLNRLKSVQYDNGARIDYGYDAAGNITTITRSATTNVGVCGAANGALTQATPGANLCSGGSASAVATSVSGFSWTCTGANGTAYCYASRGYTLTASGGGNGAVSPASQLVAYNGQGVVSVTPNSGYTAVASSNCGGSLAGTTFTSGQMTADCAVSVSFTNAPVGGNYTLVVSKTGSGLGLVASDLIGINCGGSCSANYPAGTVVTLTATPWGNTQFVGWSGACTGTGTCTVSMSAAMNVAARFDSTATSNGIGAATGNAGLFWISGGDAPWTVDSTVFHSGTSAMKSGAIGANQSSWLTTTVRGPGNLSFYWRVSSEAGYDKLTFWVDGVKQASEISGEVGWTQVNKLLAAGQHVLSWQYQKDGSGQSGSDAGWVDTIVMAPFTDVSSSAWSINYVDAIFNSGITTGCGSGNYCPTQNVTRDQMAAFIIRAKEGDPAAGYCGATPPFADVPVSNAFCGYIKRMKELAITTGCGNGNYCPTQTVTREQMAAFIIRAVEGNPPAGYCGSTSPFTDVPAASVFCGHIKRMLELNITTGCGGGNYCPTGLVTREQMAAFLARAFLGM